MREIKIVKCPCGHETCGMRHLDGIGSFYQGSGFLQEEAERIVAALKLYDSRPPRSEWIGMQYGPEGLHTIGPTDLGGGVLDLVPGSVPVTMKAGTYITNDLIIKRSGPDFTKEDIDAIQWVLDDEYNGAHEGYEHMPEVMRLREIVNRFDARVAP